jgi:hypothetical protein
MLLRPTHVCKGDLFEERENLTLRNKVFAIRIVHGEQKVELLDIVRQELSLRPDEVLQQGLLGNHVEVRDAAITALVIGVHLIDEISDLVGDLAVEHQMCAVPFGLVHGGVYNRALNELLDFSFDAPERSLIDVTGFELISMIVAFLVNSDYIFALFHGTM